MEIMYFHFLCILITINLLIIFIKNLFKNLYFLYNFPLITHQISFLYIPNYLNPTKQNNNKKINFIKININDWNFKEFFVSTIYQQAWRIHNKFLF